MVPQVPRICIIQLCCLHHRNLIQTSTGEAANSYISFLLLIILLIILLINHQNIWKYYENYYLQNIISLFMSLLTATVFKNGHIWARTYFILLENVLKQSWNSYYQILTSAKRSQKQLPSKANLSTCLELNCSNFRSKLC